MLFVVACSSAEPPKTTYQYQKLIDYPEPTSIDGQASFDNLRYKKGTVPKIAFMPPGMELPYSMAFGQGIIDTAKKWGQR